MEGMGEAMQKFIRARTRKDTLDEVEQARQSGSLEDYLKEQNAYTHAQVEEAKKRLTRTIEE